MPDPIIATHGLTKRYGRDAVGIDRLDLEVRPGEIFGFLGPNGAGKSTALRLLLDLIRPTGGRAEIFGLDTHRESVRIRERIGNLPGEVEMWRDCPGVEVLDLFAALRRGQAPLREETLRRLELSPQALTRPLRTWSRGMKQKLAIAVALQHAPPLLLLDEPTTALDPLVREALFTLLRELRGRGHTIFFSSHNLAEVEQLCDRVAILREGRLVLVEVVAALRARRVRRIDVVFRAEPAALPPLPGAVVLSRQGARVVLRVEGPIADLLPPLHALGIEDITITAPPLEEVFLEYYRGA
ncbi:MAG: ABC transporter ATP-binding protein [Planctomycetes bacterium]|nr:ABC transporter ATP-binding protein [Planctomycetota bacterium]